MALDELAQEEIVEASSEKKASVFSPAQFNLFTGVAELIPIEVPEPAENEREIRVDEGISLVKSEDGSQLIFSGFGLFLSKKSERLIARRGKDVIYQFPLRSGECQVARYFPMRRELKDTKFSWSRSCQKSKDIYLRGRN